jgi:hypothetical protein
MVETITENLEISAEPSSLRPNRIRGSSCLKYYIHDGINACRFQLIGELSEVDVPELRGCWQTAKTMLGKRRLILDLRGLKSIDEAGATWISSMVTEGAECISAPANESPGHSGKPRRFTKLLAILRCFGLSSESSTQAQ